MILLRLCHDFCSWYDACLDSFPLLTKIATTSILGLAGDAAAQVHEGKVRARLAAAQTQPPSADAAADTTATTAFRYDTRRGAANVANSVFLTAPLYHYGYDWLEGILPISTASSKATAAIAQVVIDCVFFDALFVILWVLSAWAVYRVLGRDTNGANGSSQLASRNPASIRANLLPAILACWRVDLLVLPVEYLLFRYLSLRWRVVGMNLLDLAWDAVVSFAIHDEGGVYAAAATAGGASWDQEDESQITTASESTPDTHGLWWGCRSWSRLSFGDRDAAANAAGSHPSPLDGAEGSTKQKRS